jgi:hypothetical protein
MTLRAMTKSGTNMQNPTDEKDEFFGAIGLDLDTERRSLVLAAFRPIAAEIAKLRGLDLGDASPAVVFSPVPGMAEELKETR